MLSEQYFDTGETTINYAEGSAAGPPLVLLHGLTGRWQGMQTLIAPLAPTWHIYACDLRGHGKSGRVAAQYRLTDYTQDIAAFLRSRVAEPAVLLGHSLGAWTALGTAAAVPAWVRALVLLDPPLFIRNTSIAATPQFKEWFSWVYETVQSAPSYADVVSRCRTLAPDADEASITQLADQIHSVAPDTVRIALQDELLDGFDIQAALRQIACPTLLLYGEWQHGAAMRDEDAAVVQANVPQAVIVKISNAGHGLHQEQAETVLYHIATFLETS